MFTSQTESMVTSAYSAAKENYARLGVDTDAVMQRLASVAISMHCWQAVLQLLIISQKGLWFSWCSVRHHFSSIRMKRRGRPVARRKAFSSAVNSFDFFRRSKRLFQNLEVSLLP